MYEASLDGSISRVPVLFKYFIIVDCVPRLLIEELLLPKEVKNGVYQIDGNPATELIIDLKIPEFDPSFSQNDACPLTARLESYT